MVATLLDARSTRFWDRTAPWLLYALAALVLMGLCAPVPLERNQEARVLETAREMLRQPLEAYLVPHLNGQVRLQKPPLAYWLCAGAFHLLGVGTWQGRLPMAGAGLLTIVFTVRSTRRLIGPRAAVLAGLMLLSALGFLKYGRLAETDILVTLCLTAAADALLAALACYGPDGRILHRARLYGLYHLFGAWVGLAAIAKGPPAVFALLILITWAMIERPRALLDFLASGALATLGAIALPWWLYARRRPEWSIIEQELDDLRTGRDHFAPVYFTPGFILKACLPWTPFLILALLACIRQLGSRPVRLLLAWSACIFVPLVLLPQKQEHYILPMLPPLLILTAWGMERALGGEDLPLRKAATWLLGGMTAVGCASAGVVITVAHRSRSHLEVLDIVAAALVVLYTLPLFGVYARRGLGAALAGACLSSAILMGMLTSFWGPSLRGVTFRDVAREVRQHYGAGPYALYPIENYRLNFELRQMIPVYSSPGDIPATAGLVILSEQSVRHPPAPPPLPLQAEFPMDDKVIRIYADP